jgi:hypothetical protein
MTQEEFDSKSSLWKWWNPYRPGSAFGSHHGDFNILMAFLVIVLGFLGITFFIDYCFRLIFG